MNGGCICCHLPCGTFNVPDGLFIVIDGSPRNGFSFFNDIYTTYGAVINSNRITETFFFSFFPSFVNITQEEEEGVVIGLERGEDLDGDDGIQQAVTDLGNDRSAGARARRGGGGDGDRVRGFHDMICVGFAVALCLNLGSLTAHQEGFFAAEVKCLSPGAADTFLVRRLKKQLRTWLHVFTWPHVL